MRASSMFGRPQTLVVLLACAAGGFPSVSARATPSVLPVDRFRGDATRQIESYAELAHRAYADAHRAALALQKAVRTLVRRPDAASLAAAREAWLAARPSYGQTEAFRFYGGPIDGRSPHQAAGLEGLINAWPLNEAYIDGVLGHERAGIIHAPRARISRSTLLERNARDDEADVTTGYHAIEFLLWGQDLRADGPGDRPASDFVGPGAAARRRAYLTVATDLLVDHLKLLVDAWTPGRKNYRAALLDLPPGTVLRNMLTGIATLSAFELASERLGTALDSGSQEDEQSCFSDSTHADVLANVLGIQNVYFGEYGAFHGAGLNQLVAAENPDLNAFLEKHLRATLELAAQLEAPLDQTLASPPGSARRKRLEELVSALQIQGDLLKQAAAALGVPISLGDTD